VREILAGLVGGNTIGSKVIMSPLRASSNAWLRVPGPLSEVLVTIMVLPCGTGVSVGGTGVGVDGTDVGVSATGVSAGGRLGPQPFKAREKIVATRNSEVALLIVIIH
jgi:hypothetical protein